MYKNAKEEGEYEINEKLYNSSYELVCMREKVKEIKEEEFEYLKKDYNEKTSLLLET